MMNSVKKRRLRSLLLWLILLPGLVMIVFPMYVTVITAFKTPQESAQSFIALPGGFYLENFKTVLGKNHYFTYIWNTVNLLVTVMLVEVVITPIAAYAIQRNQKRRYFGFLYAFIVCGLFVPFQVRMIPLTQMMSTLNIMSKPGLVFLYLAATAPPTVFLIVAYMKSISTEIEEAAIVDGCGPLKTYFLVVFPLLKPVLATMIIKDSLFVWNDFQLPLIILNKSRQSWTLQLFQYNFKAEYSFDYNLAFASFLMTLLPILLLYIFMQKHIVAGLSAGSVKG